VKKHINDIQILRAVAAMAVLFYHVERELSSTHSGEIGPLFVDIAWLGQAGVDVFFVISGFIMYFVHSGDFGRPGRAKDFFVRRLMRIVPTYWLLTTLTAAGLVLLPGLFNSRTPDWPAGDISPPVGPGWTLNYEMYFYVIFGALLALPRRLALPVMVAFMVGSVLLGLVMQPEVAILGMMSSALLIEFLCGIAIAWAFGRNIVLGSRTCAALLVAGAAPFFGLPAAALMAAVVLRPGVGVAPGPVAWFFGRLGASSYAMYLTHIFTLRTAGIVLDQMLPPLLLAVDFALLFVLAVAVGHLFFLIVERPIYHLLKARLLSKKTMEEPA